MCYQRAARGGGHHFNGKPPRRFLSPVESHQGGVGPLPGGEEQGEWTWVSYRGRKVLGPEKSGQNGQRKGNGYGGSRTSKDSGFERYGDDRMGNRSRNRERWCAEFPRFRVLHKYGRGRSMTHRRDRPFSCTREVVPKQWEDQYHPTNDICYSTTDMVSYPNF